MSKNPIRDDTAHVYCSAATKAIVYTLKRDSETYDEKLRQMVVQYDPDAACTREAINGGF